MKPTLEQWIARQYQHSAAGLLASISAVDIIKQRPGFAQSVRPLPGSVVASPVLAAYDPDPDYFFHWYRDSALVIDALRLLWLDGATDAADATARYADFVTFSLALRRLDGRALAAEQDWRARVAPQFARYLRSDAELSAVHGPAVAADTRVNPDGTLDISQWARPQHDGPALRALTLLRWEQDLERQSDTGLPAPADRHVLLRADLDYACSHGHEPCFDIWEEEPGSHYYTLRVSAAALEHGVDWLARQGDASRAQVCRARAGQLLQTLERFWLADQSCYRSRLLPSGERSAKELDIAVILAVLHAGTDESPRHSVRDPRLHATLSRLEAQFRADYAINHDRPQNWAPALGRYPGDHYYSGGAYYFSTLAAAEFCFRAAAAAATGNGEAARQWFERGERYLETVRAFTPENGELSEQFDQRTGRQTSARQLAWSYAAFISAAHARRACLERTG